jgi:hypothetical protein
MTTPFGSKVQGELSELHLVDDTGLVIDWPVDEAGRRFDTIELGVDGTNMHVKTGDGNLLGTDVVTFAQASSGCNRYLYDGDIIPDLARKRRGHTKLAMRTLGTLAATGSITTVAGGSLVDGTDTFVIDDGINAAVTFEFDSDSSVVETATLRAVPFTGGDTADQVRDAIITAITNSVLLTPSNGGAGLVSLTHDVLGIVGNQTITENVANAGFLVSGMSGGTGTSCTVRINPGV